MHARAVAIALLLVVALSAAACGSSGGTASSPAAAGAVTITDAWVRAKEAGGTTAAYMQIANGGSADDQLVNAAAPDVTMEASIHETTSDGSGMTGMQHVDAIAVPAGGTVALEPGGYHIMLMNLTKDLKVGDSVTITLTFDGAGEVQVTAEVRAG